MKNLNTFEINTLHDYIILIKENKLNNYFFRGENMKYPAITSSLLRKDEKVLLKQNIYKFYESIVNDYYNEIATYINEFDRSNFLAFSQHHGLSTNLIDLTMSPLIALYFACTKNISNKLNDKGYVYLIKKEKTIDISRLINEFFIPPTGNYNLIEMFRCNSPQIVKELITCFNNYFWINGFEPYLPNLIKQCSDLANTSVGQIQIFFDNYKKSIQNPDILDDSNIFYKLLFENSSIGLKLGDCSNNTGIFLNLLYEFFDTLTSISFFSNETINIRFPDMPYFIYRTPYKFDRIRSQEGLFLYQLYHTYATEYEDEPNKIIKQDITPDLTIVINHQKEILDELDFIGVNLKSIYGDYDNIATYINRKHFYI